MLLISWLALSVFIWHPVCGHLLLDGLDVWERRTDLRIPTLAALSLSTLKLLINQIVSVVILWLKYLIVTLLQLLVMIFYQLTSILGLFLSCISQLRFSYSSILVIFYWRIWISLIFEILLTVILASGFPDQFLQISWWVLIDIKLRDTLIISESFGSLVLLSLNHSFLRKLWIAVPQPLIKEFQLVSQKFLRNMWGWFILSILKGLTNLGFSLPSHLEGWTLNVLSSYRPS